MKKKILLVDNVNTILEREKGLLNREDFQVFLATSGEEAIEVHRREKLDVIIIDLNMPGMPGDQVCRMIRDDKDLKKVSILIAIMDDSVAEIERCRKAGANGHIKKPTDRDDLAQKLAKLLDIPTRQSIRILVRIKLDARVGSEFFIATTVDVSATGLLFESERVFKAGDQVETSFFLPGQDGFKRVVAWSQVMRVSDADGNAKRYGVKFAEFKEGGTELITEFVARKTAKA